VREPLPGRQSGPEGRAAASRGSVARVDIPERPASPLVTHGLGTHRNVLYTPHKPGARQKTFVVSRPFA